MYYHITKLTSTVKKRDTYFTLTCKLVNILTAKHINVEMCVHRYYYMHLRKLTQILRIHIVYNVYQKV